MKLLRMFCRASYWFGGLLILLSSLIIGVDVIMRQFFSATIGGASELSGYALAIGTTWGLAGALLDRAHIRTDSAYIMFPLKLRIFLDILGIILLALVFAVITWYGMGVLTQSIISDTHSQSALETPLIIPQALWLLGLILFLLTCMIVLFRSLYLVSRKRWIDVEQLISTRSTREDVQEEVEDFDRRQAEWGQS
ncbi:MAG: TRAP transporter small permease [Castellaniella sp.]|uniref:TRAP transporter small permease subunit n=1 Tax=Castellaniella sp. TaxID=1955812 RepID=UPI0011FB635E|nr:TRAP transporter small permease [Castellaniella sp.]TAN25125.1 MAG: TRAP transporter small permease [Castellaniella sp.]